MSDSRVIRWLSLLALLVIGSMFYVCVRNTVASCVAGEWYMGSLRAVASLVLGAQAWVFLHVVIHGGKA